MAAMPARLSEIWQYPIKSFNGRPLERCRLSESAGLPGDRRYALVHSPLHRIPVAPTTTATHSYIQLESEARLALLEAKFDEDGHDLGLFRQGRQVAHGDIATPIGRTLIEQFLASFLGTDGRGLPKLIEAERAPLSDSGRASVSLINLASLHDLERVARDKVDPRRFRANLWLDGIPAWAELSWTGREIRIGDTRLKVLGPIERCAATNVNPDSAERDMNIPRLLERGFGHMNFGVYAQVIAGGEIAPGDRVAPPTEPPAAP